jgi:uncharacterized protein YggT (Ycf19 family)
MWLIVGRIVLGLFTRGKPNFILNFFVKFTDPWYRIIRKIMPFAGEKCVPFLSILSIILIRMAIIILFGTGMPKQ